MTVCLQVAAVAKALFYAPPATCVLHASMVREIERRQDMHFSVRVAFIKKILKYIYKLLTKTLPK